MPPFLLKEKVARHPDVSGQADFDAEIVFRLNVHYPKIGVW